ncbi:MAG: MFS transporter [Actinocatenispora sp.]
MPAPTPGIDDRPATYRELFAVREYRAVYAAGALSSIGDYLGKVALAALMYQATGSVLASAASLAITYLPWLTGAPFLVALAERHPQRRVMLACDIARIGLVAVAALPGLPVVLLPALMFLTAMLSPPFESSRSALLPTILSGERYVLGLAVNGITVQIAQFGGFVFGGAIAAVNARGALAADAATFGVSALLIGLGVVARPAVPPAAGRRGLLREAVEGFTVVFGNRVLRSIALVVLSGMAFSVLPEGLSAGWAHDLGGGAAAQGMLMAAEPVGMAVGGVVIGRLLAPSVRRRLLRPLAMLVPLPLVGALAAPSLPVVLFLAALTGFAMSMLFPANALFVRALPDGYRARAFGVMQAGFQLVQGTAILGGGAVAGLLGVNRTVGLWSLVGVAVMAAVSWSWPTPSRFEDAFAQAQSRNSTQRAEEPAASGQSTT